MKTIRNLIFACAGGIAIFSLAACQNESVDPARARRAVESPGERNSTSGEMANLASISGIPLVEVDLANSRNQPPQVHTIADVLANPPTVTAPTSSTTITTHPQTGVKIGASTTQPQPPTTQPSTRIDPLLGPQD